MTGTVTAALFAAGLGFGVYLMLRGMRRRSPELASLLDEQATRSIGRPTLDRQPVETQGLKQRFLGQPGARLLRAFGLAGRRSLQDQLRILDKSVEQHAYEKMLGAVVGVIIPILLFLVLRVSGYGFAPINAVLGSLAMGALGFWYPELPLSDLVEQRQQAFRHALAGYLDLVTIIVAGGGGIESALSGAADAGDGWVFGELRAALRRGQLTGKPPWVVFDELGAHYGVTEMQDLAASMTLAGGHGARVRQSLIAKADALRAQQASELEGKAESSTEKMIVPVSIMVLGLMLFIGVGALAAMSPS